MIANFLDLHSKYITSRDHTLLRTPGFYPSPMLEHEYGCFVHVDLSPEIFEDQLQEIVGAGFSEHFVKIMRYAHQNKCWWINFDRDGTDIDADGFPTFE